MIFTVCYAVYAVLNDLVVVRINLLILQSLAKMASSGNFYMYLLFGENYCDFRKFCLFGLMLYMPVNSYGHVGTVISINHTFSWASLTKLLTSTLCTYFRL